jgi:predicted dehydrogenase
MRDTRVLVIGAGSIGVRHATLLATLGANVWVMDPDFERSTRVPGGKPAAFDLGQLHSYEGVVVASPTVYHSEQVAAALRAGTKVLVEKPAATTVAELDSLLPDAKGRLMVGYNLRLHEPLERIVALAHRGVAGKIVAVRAWFGSYLPDWRPDVDYRTTYSARSELAGGVLLDAIHELDMLVWLLGREFEVRGAVIDRVGYLDIDVEDTVKALLQHDSGCAVELSLDYLSRRYRRGLEIVGLDATLRLDWARALLEVETAEGTRSEPADVPVSRSYERQAAQFLAWLQGKADPPVDGEESRASVALADAIRAAAT